MVRYRFNNVSVLSLVILKQKGVSVEKKASVERKLLNICTTCVPRTNFAAVLDPDGTGSSILK